MERPIQSEVVARLEDRSIAPFPADRLLWSDADFEEARIRMKNLPCIRNAATAEDTLEALAKLGKSLGGTYDDVWESRVESFSPEQVAMRYGYGEDWSYEFHQQRKLEEGKTTYVQDYQTESSVTGIAKRMVREVGKLVRGAKRDMVEVADPEERKRIGEELVDQAENIFDDIYRKEPEQDRISVTKLDGPRGPVYLCIENGNHRLAAARLIGLRRVRGEVTSFRDGKGSQHWFDFLAALPATSRMRWRDLYEQIYPPSKEEAAKDDAQESAAVLRSST